MKTVYFVFGGILISAILFGVLIPFLISSKSWIGFALGVSLICAYILSVINFFVKKKEK